MPFVEAAHSADSRACIRTLKQRPWCCRVLYVWSFGATQPPTKKGQSNAVMLLCYWFLSTRQGALEVVSYREPTMPVVEWGGMVPVNGMKGWDLN